jgi:hypothetical protein
MPAALPGSTAAQNAANPNAGRAVIFDLLSGPKGSPFDKDAAGYATTGLLATGIGFGSPPIIGPTAPASIKAAGFNDDYTVGVTKPDGLASADSTIMYIGGGRCNAPSVGTGIPAPNPYTTGFGIGMAGNGGSRDAGSGPAFQGFKIKTVTATGAVANGAAVETGWLNRSGIALTTGQSVFGSSTTASGAVA